MFRVIRGWFVPVAACFYTLIGQAQDFEAVKRAAEQGDALAQNDLAFMYANGQGVERNYAEAVKWQLKAAQQGHWEAQYRLGEMYAHGLGVPKNVAEAVKWWYRVACWSQGDHASSNHKRIGKDAQKAIEREAKLGNEEAQEVLKTLEEAMRWDALDE
jgi:TPR repeat protein